jgi:hypothetical protein
MKTPDSRALMLAIRAWIGEDESGRNAERVIKYLYEMAVSGHFGFFKLLIDVIDGKVRPTAEDEMTFESDCVIVVSDELLRTDRIPELVKAA